MFGGAEYDRLLHLQGSLDIGEHQRRGPVGHQRAIGALERSGDARVLLALFAAKLVTEILADLRVGIIHAVLVVLGGDARERVRLVAPALEIKAGDLAEDAGEAAVDIGLLAHVGRLEKITPDLRGGRRRHLLDADDQHDAGGAGGNRLQSLMDGGGAGRAGILHAGRALETKIGRGLQDQRGGEILRREAGVEMTEHDLVDILRRDAGIGQRLAGDVDDETFDRFAGELAERRVGPTYDASGHVRFPLSDFGRFSMA